MKKLKKEEHVEPLGQFLLSNLFHIRVDFLKINCKNKNSTMLRNVIIIIWTFL